MLRRVSVQSSPHVVIVVVLPNIKLPSLEMKYTISLVRARTKKSWKQRSWPHLIE